MMSDAPDPYYRDFADETTISIAKWSSTRKESVYGWEGFPAGAK